MLKLIRRNLDRAVRLAALEAFAPLAQAFLSNVGKTKPQEHPPVVDSAAPQQIVSGALDLADRVSMTHKVCPEADAVKEICDAYQAHKIDLQQAVEQLREPVQSLRAQLRADQADEIKGVLKADEWYRCLGNKSFDELKLNRAFLEVELMHEANGADREILQAKIDTVNERMIEKLDNPLTVEKYMKRGYEEDWEPALKELMARPTDTGIPLSHEELAAVLHFVPVADIPRGWIDHLEWMVANDDDVVGSQLASKLLAKMQRGSEAPA